MNIVEKLADDLSKEIALKYQYFSTGTRADIKAMIVRQFQAVVPEPQQSLSFEDEKKNAAQAGAILALLKKRRHQGATTVELNAICCNYTARVSELRISQHYKIHCTRGVGRNFTYRLHETDW